MIRTKRWNDPIDPRDGYRHLICRYRPRGVARAGEPWNAWCPEVAPSADLLAAYLGKKGPKISWKEYSKRYLAEMSSRTFWIRGLRERSKTETLTLLCSSACTDESHCHRTLLKELLESE